jgi:hypothetical protein
LHPPQKLQRPKIFPECVACLFADVTIFHHLKAKTFCLVSFLAIKKRCLPPRKIFFYFLFEKVCQTNFFALFFMKNCQHQHRGKPHAQAKSKDAASFFLYGR